MKSERDAYVNRVLELYLSLPETPARFSRFDRQLAERLYKDGISVEQIETAFLLGSARRLARSESEPPLGPIRSLHYFIPILCEVKLNPLTLGYIRYLRRRLVEDIKQRQRLD